MNVKRFTARNSREALRLVREALGDDAVVLSTKPSAGGVEVAGDGAGEHRPARGHVAGSPRRADASRRREPAAELAATSADAGRRAALDEHAVVPGLRPQAHAEARARHRSQAAAGSRAGDRRAAAAAPMPVDRQRRL